MQTSRESVREGFFRIGMNTESALEAWYTSLGDDIKKPLRPFIDLLLYTEHQHHRYPSTINQNHNIEGQPSFKFTLSTPLP